MKTREQLDALRSRIDAIDEQLLPLLGQRMAVVDEVARLKREENLPILDAKREQEIVDRLAQRADPGLQSEAAMVMRTLFALSRGRQRRALYDRELGLLPPASPPAKEEGLVCTYQGVPGAWSEQALIQRFPAAERLGVEQFEDVFVAVKEGRARYGVAAIENSQTGAVGETYDLLRRYGCFVVGKTRVEIRQCLLAPQGVSLRDIRVVYSHPQGFKQCRRYLRDKSWELAACGNTAVAAQLAAADSAGHTAAIGSRRAAECHGVAVLAPDIMDSRDNQTTFVVIAAAPEYDQNSDMIAVTFSVAHRGGALCEALMPFAATGLNLQRIESRPGSGGNYRFFADIEGNLLDDDTARALRQAAAASEYFEVIGCYRGR